MIILTRLGGNALAVNPDLIERAEATPDTVLTMIDGHKIVVAEGLDEFVELVRSWRAGVAARAWQLGRDGEPVTAADRDHVIEHTEVQESLARVLRLPKRGE